MKGSYPAMYTLTEDEARAVADALSYYGMADYGHGDMRRSTPEQEEHVRLIDSVQSKLDAEPQSTASVRAIDLMHQEARARALRFVHGVLLGVQQHLADANYGLAHNVLNALVRDLDDSHGTSALVRGEVEKLAEQVTA